jgi:hypothetical protein
LKELGEFKSGTVSLGVKQLRYEADHLPPSSAEVKNAWSYTSTPPYVFMAWCLVKHRDNFTFIFISISNAKITKNSSVFSNSEYLRKITLFKKILSSKQIHRPV